MDGCGQDGNRGGDEQLYSWCFSDLGGGWGITHYFLGGGARKVPFTALEKAVRSHEKSSILTSLTSCWVPRVLFRKEEGRDRRGHQVPVMEYKASGKQCRVSTVAAGAGPCHTGD